MSALRFPFLILFSFATVQFDACSARAQDQPEHNGRVITVQPRKGWHLVNGHWLRASGSFEWPDVLAIDWHGETLRIAIEPSARCSSVLANDRRAAVEMGASDDLFQIEMHELPRGALPDFLGGGFASPREDGKPGRDRFVLAQAMNEARPAGVTEESLPLHPRSLVAAPGVLKVNCRGMLEARSVSITFNMRPNETQLLVTIDGIDTNLRAASLGELLRDHPIELRRYLSPVLRCIRSDGAGDLLAAGWADIYLTFDRIAPPPRIVEKVNAILPHLQSDEAKERNAAMDQLRSLGGAGVCALARLKTNDLPAQTRVLIDQLLAEQSHRGIAAGLTTAADLKRDRLFLLDCLDVDDLAVRAAAVEQLPPEPKIDPKDALACARISKQLRDELLQSGR